MTQVMQPNSSKVLQEQKAIACALKNHVKDHQVMKNDAKSILLVDEVGEVAEPTPQTVKLLGMRTSG